MTEDIVLDTARPRHAPPSPPPAAPAAIEDRDAVERRQRAAEAHHEYGRGRKIAVKAVKDRKLRGQLKRLEDKYQEATLRAKDAEILLEHDAGFIEPEHALERSYKVRQDEIRQTTDIETAKKGFELRLAGLGPYVAEYTRNGKWLLLAGRKGHVSTMAWRAGTLGCELQLQETVRDAKWLHNELFFAVAQKQFVYIYDQAGVELHCLRKLVEVSHLEFLPYHFLLSSIGLSGYLKYTDTSTGQMVTEIMTKQRTTTTMAQNPYNAIIHLGHQNGTVSLWSPNSTTPLAKMLVHRGPVRSMAMDREGRYMVSTGQDKKMAVWDIRMFRAVHQYFVRQPGASVAISNRNLTAVGWGTQVSIWRDLFSKAVEDQAKAQAPYMAWGGDGQYVERVRWCPLEDVLGVGHDQGFSSLLVPGAGESNYDALEANPFETVKQRQEGEVKALLNKLQPEMIALNPDFVGNLNLASEATRQAEQQIHRDGVLRPDPLAQVKNRGRGKNSTLRKYLRKKGSRNIIDERRERIEALRQATNAKTRRRVQQKQETLGPALGRFVRKGRE